MTFRQTQDRHDTAEICLKGHVTSTAATTTPQFHQAFCEKCGAKVVSQCQACGADIRGQYLGSGAISFSTFPRPDFCIACGVPYPWTAASMDAWHEIVAMLDNLKPDEKNRLDMAIDDLMRVTPGTPKAVLILKTVGVKAGGEALTALRAIVVDIASAAVKQQLGTH